MTYYHYLCHFRNSNVRLTVKQKEVYSFIIEKLKKDKDANLFLHYIFITNCYYSISFKVFLYNYEFLDIIHITYINFAKVYFMNLVTSVTLHKIIIITDILLIIILFIIYVCIYTPNFINYH